MKIYAKQVPPECQESPIFYAECFPDNIAVCGNRDFNRHTPEIFDKVLNVLEAGEVADILENFKDWGQWYKNATEAITEYLPPAKGKYSTNAIHALKSLICDYSSCSSSAEDEILLKALSIVTSKKWNCRTIRGCSQSEWQEIFYPVDDWSKEALTTFGAEYFNTGTEWIVHDEEADPESPEDVSGYSIYCTSWNDEGIKQEIAEASGGSPEDVLLYTFDGYRQTALYKEV